MNLKPDWEGQLYVLQSLPRATAIPPESVQQSSFGERVEMRDFLLLESSNSERYIGNVESRDFWVLHRSGKVVAQYGYEFYSDCEYGLPRSYEMKGGTLFKYSGSCNDAVREALCTWVAEVVCEAWKKLAADHPEAIEFRNAYERQTIESNDHST